MSLPRLGTTRETAQRIAGFLNANHPIYICPWYQWEPSLVPAFLREQLIQHVKSNDSDSEAPEVKSAGVFEGEYVLIHRAPVSTVRFSLHSIRAIHQEALTNAMRYFDNYLPGYFHDKHSGLVYLINPRLLQNLLVDATKWENEANKQKDNKDYKDYTTLLQYIKNEIKNLQTKEKTAEKIVKAIKKAAAISQELTALVNGFTEEPYDFRGKYTKLCFACQEDQPLGKALREKRGALPSKTAGKVMKMIKNLNANRAAVPIGPQGAAATAAVPLRGAAVAAIAATTSAARSSAVSASSSSSSSSSTAAAIAVLGATSRATPQVTQPTPQAAATATTLATAATMTATTLATAATMTATTLATAATPPATVPASSSPAKTASGATAGGLRPPYSAAVALSGGSPTYAGFDGIIEPSPASAATSAAPRVGRA